jgi:hypothetical protein
VVVRCVSKRYQRLPGSSHQYIPLSEVLEILRLWTSRCQSESVCPFGGAIPLVEPVSFGVVWWSPFGVEKACVPLVCALWCGGCGVEKACVPLVCAPLVCAEKACVPLVCLLWCAFGVEKAIALRYRAYLILAAQFDVRTIRS